jgi:signal transduction histidine kinase
VGIETQKLERRLARAVQKTVILERMMEDRTREMYVQQQSLVAAQKDLVSIIFGLNHDLRAPINTVLGFVHAMEEDLAQGHHGELAMLAAKAREQCLGLQSLVSGLVDLVERDRVAGTAVEAIAFPDFFHEVERLLGEGYAGSRVKVRLEAGNIGEVTANRAKLLHVLLNLVGNGIRYRDEKKLDQFVQVSVRNSLDEGNFIVKVEDNGIGISEAELPKIFEMFYRCGSTQRDGSGLGLYLVRSYVRSMGGSVGVRSSSEGTTFTVALPLVPSGL